MKKFLKRSLKRPLKRSAVKDDEIRAIVRPSFGKPKKHVTLRLDPDLVEHYRACGPGWHTRINDVLRKAAHLPKRDKRL
jgi:uncharacterized protein (DUF4415 family)